MLIRWCLLNRFFHPIFVTSSIFFFIRKIRPVKMLSVGLAITY